MSDPSPSESSLVQLECQLFLDGHARFRAGHKKARERLGSGFVTLLGCSHLLMNSRTSCPTIEASKDLVAIQESLPRILVAMGSKPRAPLDSTIVLAGLSRYDCWKTCLKDEESTYLLAAGIVGYLETYTRDFQPDVAAEAEICVLLNQWLQPEAPWTKAPSVQEVVTYMFNEVWCSLRVPATKDDVPDDEPYGSRYIAKLIYQERPPFLIGLCPAQQQIMSVPLPDDFLNTP